MKKSLIATVSIYAGFFTAATVAQGTGTVVESQPFTPGQTQAAAPATAPGNNDALSLLLEQNQQLRTELQALRALLEEQGFEVRKLQRDSLTRYTDMDQRLSALENAAVTPGDADIAASDIAASDIAASGIDASGIAASDIPTSRGALPTPVTPPDITPVVTADNGVGSTTPRRPDIGTETRTPEPRGSGRSRGTLQPAVLSEQQLYQMAYDSAINSNFERSIAEFEQYLSIYPEGRFAANTHYWKGQAYLYLDRYDEARESYEIILNQYPDSAKLSDAMYGLGLAYQGLGNIAQARQLLNEIKRRFPNTGVANLADTRLLILD